MATFIALLSGGVGRARKYMAGAEDKSKNSKTRELEKEGRSIGELGEYTKGYEGI